MIVDRAVIHAKFGKGGELAAIFAKTVESMMKELGVTRKWRVLTDRSGTFDTVVFELEAESIAEHDALRARIFQTKAFRDSMAQMQGLQAGGHREFYAIEAQG